VGCLRLLVRERDIGLGLFGGLGWGRGADRNVHAPYCRACSERGGEVI
jgi:hypothetical protein